MWLLAKNLVFTVIVPGAVVVLLPRAILDRWSPGGLPAPAPMRASGLAVVLAGACLFASALATFALAGKATPAPVDPPKVLVVSGPYRWVRNPMYVGVILLLAGEALYFAAASLAVYTAACFAAFHAFAVLYEEPHLRDRFGEAYVAYRAAVPRWLPRTPAPPAGRG